MRDRPNHIPKIIIPLAIGISVLGYVATRPGAHAWVGGILLAVMILGIPLVVGFLLLGESGWRELWRAFPGGRGFRGPWHTCRTAVMSQFALDDPQHRRRKVRFNFVVRAGADAQGLHLATLPVVGWLLPRISIPWTEIARARHFDASGWVTPSAGPGALVQATYDPGYRGHFVELEIAQPKYFLQLPAAPLQAALPAQLA